MSLTGGASTFPPKQPKLSLPRHRLEVTAACAAPRQAENGLCCSGKAGEGQQEVSPGEHGDGATHSSCTAAGLCCVWESGPNPAGTRDRGSPGVGIGVLAPAQGTGQDGAGQGGPHQAGGTTVGSTGPAWNVACRPEQGPHRSGSWLSPRECRYGLRPITPQKLPRLDPLARPSAKPSRDILDPPPTPSATLQGRGRFWGRLRRGALPSLTCIRGLGGDGVPGTVRGHWLRGQCVPQSREGQSPVPPLRGVPAPAGGRDGEVSVPQVPLAPSCPGRARGRS